MSRTNWLGYCAFLLAALAGTAGCGAGDGAPSEEQVTGTPTPGKEGSEETGSLAFALTAQNGVEFDSFSYAITGPSFTRSGNIDVSQSTTVSALIEGIPPATGYAITLMGSSTVPVDTSCSGSASFDVAAGVVTDVPVAISCRVLQTPAVPAPVPIPPFAPAVLGFALLTLGAVAARSRRSA